MTDAIDEMFAKDLHKLSMPSEMALNAAKVKAAQTDKKGAEKPDLYAKGKGKGKDGKPAKDEENDERKSKGPNKGDKKDPEDLKKDKQQGAKSKDDMDKKASIDDEFNGHMAQVVGLDVPEAAPDFERPNVKIAGQAEDAIDMHLIGWMQEKADEDVVKVAGTRDVMREVVGSGNVDRARKLLKQKLKGAAGKGAAVATAVTAPVAGAAGYAAGKKSEKKAELDKEAGVIENPENLDLLARIRKKAGGGLVVGSGDV